jgi:hypothetical protein
MTELLLVRILVQIFEVFDQLLRHADVEDFEVCAAVTIALTRQHLMMLVEYPAASQMPCCAFSCAFSCCAFSTWL